MRVQLIPTSSTATTCFLHSSTIGGPGFSDIPIELIWWLEWFAGQKDKHLIGTWLAFLESSFSYRFPLLVGITGLPKRSSGLRVSKIWGLGSGICFPLLFRFAFRSLGNRFRFCWGFSNQVQVGRVREGNSSSDSSSSLCALFSSVQDGKVSYNPKGGACFPRPLTFSVSTFIPAFPPIHSFQ